MDMTVSDVLGAASLASAAASIVLCIIGLCMSCIWPDRTWCLTFSDFWACMTMKFKVVELVYSIVFTLAIALAFACAVLGSIFWLS